jgi:arylsulfatase A-like enzyme
VNERRDHGRGDILFGLGWFVGLYTHDLITSYWLLTSALRKVKGAPDVTRAVVWAVFEQLARMLGAYLLMGLVAGAMLLLARRAFGGSDRPVRWRIGLLALVTLWIWGRGAVLWPRMYLGGLGSDWFGNRAEVWWFDALLVLCVAALAVWRRSVLSVRHLLATLAGAIAISFADAHPPATKPVTNAGPNVLLVGFDALRPDHLKSFGYERDTAPRLDAFLARSTVYTDAFTPLARTWPAWMSVLTGAEPVVHGQRDSLPDIGDERPSVPMITDVLRDAGIYTSFVTDDSRFSYMLPSHNFQGIEQPLLGIASFVFSRNQPMFRSFFNFMNGPFGWWLVPIYRYNQSLGITHRPEYMAEKVADLLADASRHDRFFLAAHFCILHSPGDRSYPYDRMYGMADYVGDNRYAYRSTGSELADDEGLDSEKLLEAERASRQQNLNLYDAGIAMIDLTWARIERALDDAGLWDDTLVIVMSDHGEDFLEDDTRYKFRGPNHGFHPWGIGQNRVLLAVHTPASLGGTDAGWRDGMVGLVDIAPTISRAMGVPFAAPNGIPLQGEIPEGRLMFGETGVSERSYWDADHITYSFRRPVNRYTVDPATGRVYQPQKYKPETVRAKDRWVADETFWMTEEALRAGPRYQLFRWREDPNMAHDVSEQYPDDRARLIAALQARPRGGPEPLDSEPSTPTVAEGPPDAPVGIAPMAGPRP